MQCTVCCMSIIQAPPELEQSLPCAQSQLTLIHTHTPCRTVPSEGVVVAQRDCTCHHKHRLYRLRYGVYTIYATRHCTCTCLWQSICNMTLHVTLAPLGLTVRLRLLLLLHCLDHCRQRLVASHALSHCKLYSRWRQLEHSLQRQHIM